MTDYADRLERDFPVRHKDREKTEFRTFLMHELKGLGYAPRLESRESALAFGGNITNVVAGDVETAKLVLTAHYDTPLHDLFPPLLLPGRPLTYGLYLALTPLCALLGSFLISFALTFALNVPQLTLPLFLLLLLAAILYLRFGASERNNLCDNTSGVAALLETAAALTPRYRAQTAFVFLDGGTSGNAGARALRKKYPSLREKPVIDLNCLAQGDEVLILPGKYARWDGDLLDAFVENFENGTGKTCFLKTDGFAYYPSDCRVFRLGVALCACEKIAGFGRVIRPRRAQEIDRENLRLVREGLCRLIAAYGH